MTRTVRTLPTVVALAAATALAFTGCAPANTSPDDATDELVIATGSQINSYDPPDVGDNPATQYLQPVYDTLFRIDENAEIQPRLVTEWEYDETRTQLTLTLREDVTFSDGEAFDAEAVRINLEHFLAGTGPAVRTVAGIENVEVVEEHLVRLDLAAPNPALLRYLGLTAGMMASPAAIEAGELASAPVGSGPYTLDTGATVPQSRYVYTRNDSYWDQDAYPYESVIITPISDFTARINALRTGQADVGTQMNSRYIAEAESAGLEITTFPSGDVMGLDLFDRGGTFVDALADPRVRRAMNMAIDREQIVEQLYDGFGSVTSQVFNPDSIAWQDDLNEQYPFDPDAARALLAESGYADGVTITIPEYSGVSDLIVVLQQQLGEVGITLEGRAVPDAQANTEMRSGNYPAALIQLQSNDPWQAIQLMLEPAAPWNALGYEDDRVSALIAQAQAGTEEDRANAYQELNRYLVDEAWFMPVLFTDTIMVTAADVDLTTYKYSVVPPLEAYAPSA